MDWSGGGGGGRRPASARRSAAAGAAPRGHPGHQLLESEEVCRLGVRARPLDHDAPLKPGKLYFLVEIPRGGRGGTIRSTRPATHPVIRHGGLLPPPPTPPKPILSARWPHLPAAPAISTTTVRCTAAPKPATSTPKPSQEEAVSRELQQVPQEPSERPLRTRRTPIPTHPRQGDPGGGGGDHLLRGGAAGAVRHLPGPAAADGADRRRPPPSWWRTKELPLEKRRRPYGAEDGGGARLPAEAEYPGLLAGARASCPHGGGVADAGHRYVF
ncbi:hypothetical protein PVAP13_9NG295473 [Panicum virgatum]|uniref:Uncharacterized protein n=1 Tax=Panicum virgatum TaxID=38727 RepID=A0A8T0MPY9_PANVG|nr:hypothetical protein PVAP13_9NG295473 [Panicum virgatum]